MGRRKFSQGGGLRRVGKAERNRFRQRQSSSVVDIQRSRIKLTEEILEDIFMAQALYDASDWEACEVATRKLLKHGFSQPMTYVALANCAQFQGRLSVAIECLRKALEIDPTYAEARNQIIMIIDAAPKTTVSRAAREREKWWACHGAHLYEKRKPHLNDRDPERPLRVGYVSGDFYHHSASTVFHRIVTRHTDAVQPFLYASTPHHKYDPITNTYRSMPGWRDVANWPASMVADKIRSDRIDILVDMTAYTANSQLQVFCYKPAPIQCSGWGYATGTGLPAMDYLFADRYVVPEDRQHEHTERIAYLPSIIDYEGMPDWPESGPLPCLTERPTFGMFQRSLKINAEDIGVWRRILRRLPESRLIVKSSYSPTFQQWMLGEFGDEATQVEIQGATSSLDHRKAHAQLDLSLDCWPQTGGVSACDSLWAGVPMVTLTGDRVIQRTTASLLTIVGLPQFIAHSHQEYVDIAVRWVTEKKDELAEIRAGLRTRFEQSPICSGYLEAVEQVYRDLWREWCATPLTIADAMYRLEAVS